MLGGMKMLKKNSARTKEYLDKYYKAKNLYLNNGLSLTQAAATAGIDRRSLSRSLKEEGYEIINKQNATKFDETVFDTIDTEEKAYWLGFLYADGAIGSTRNSIELSLKASDINHLKKFRKFLNFSIDKHIYQDDIRCRICINNKHLKEILISLGCTPRKSLTITFPSEQQVPKYLQKDFIRGYIDGDGSVMFNTRHTCGRLSILGTSEMLENIIEVMKWKHTKIRKKDSENVYTVEWCGYYVTKYLDQLYENSTIYLDRKYKRYLEIKDLTRCRSKK